MRRALATLSALDGWDVLTVAAGAALFVGLVLVAGLGWALIVAGILGVAAGVVGARGAELAAALESRRGGGG